MSLLRVLNRGPVAAAKLALPLRAASGSSAWALHDFNKPLTEVPQVEVDGKKADLIVQEGTTIKINPALKGKIGQDYAIRLRHLLPPGVQDYDYARVTGMLMWPTASQAQLLNLEKGDWSKLTKEEKLEIYRLSFPQARTETNRVNMGDVRFSIAGTLIGLALSYFIWKGITKMMNPDWEPPRTLTKEWMDASLEKAKKFEMNPMNGYSAK